MMARSDRRPLGAPRGAEVVELDELDPEKVRYVIGIGDSGDARDGGRADDRGGLRGGDPRPPHGHGRRRRSDGRGRRPGGRRARDHERHARAPLAAERGRGASRTTARWARFVTFSPGVYRERRVRDRRRRLLRHRGDRHASHSGSARAPRSEPARSCSKTCLTGRRSSACRLARLRRIGPSPANWLPRWEAGVLWRT